MSWAVAPVTSVAPVVEAVGAACKVVNDKISPYEVPYELKPTMQ